MLAPDAGGVRRFGGDAPNGQSLGRTTVFLPADRLAEGLLPGMTIRHHRILAEKGRFFLSAGSGLTESRQAIEQYNIKGDPDSPVEELSGGNQQRLLLSLIPAEVRLILMENPTRGLDVQSAAWTWHQLHRQRPKNGAIVFASPDLEEIMAQAGRVLVFYDGRIVLDTPTRLTDRHEISRAITGGAGEEGGRAIPVHGDGPLPD
jgi:simple sugar transport system ATP-binding protein